LLAATTAHRGHQLIATESGSAIGCHHLAVAHDHNAIGIFENFAQEMRNQDATNTVRYHAPHVREQLSSPMAVER